MTILRLSSSALALADPLNKGLNLNGLLAPPPERPEPQGKLVRCAVGAIIASAGCRWALSTVSLP